MDPDIHLDQTGARQTANVDNTGAVYHRPRDVYNGPVNQQTISQDNSRTYTVPKEDNLLSEIISRAVLGLLGERNALIAGIGMLAIGIGFVAAPFVSIPSALAFLVPDPSYGIWLIVAGVLLFAALQYKADRQCDECGGSYALREVGQGEVREVDTPEGVRRTTTRTYECRACGHRTPKVNPELISREQTPAFR